MNAEGEDDDIWGSPPPPEDRVWRHPSELRHLAGITPSGGTVLPSPRRVIVVKQRRPLSLAAAALAGALLVGAAWFVLGGVTTRTVRVTERVRVAPYDSTPPRLVEADDWPTAVALGVWPSLARIELDSADPVTGVVVRDDGLVITAASSLAGEQEMSVRLSTGEVVRALVLGVDPVTDLAVLRLDARGLLPALLAKDDTPNLGASVATVGINAEPLLGEIEDQGAVVRVGQAFHPDLLAIRAPGSTPGSPVLDETGAVMAIVTSLASGDIVYAVPIDSAAEIVAAIDTNNDIDHDGWMGVEVANLDPETASLLFHGSAVEVTDLVAGGPAAAGGLRRGDIISRVNRRVVGNDATFAILVRSLVPGDTVTVELFRDGSPLVLEVDLLARPAR